MLFHAVVALGGCLFVFSPLPIQAAVYRAVLVGIDRYSPPQATVPVVKGATIEERPANATPVREGVRGQWTDLDGAVNDVEALKALLITPRYGFKAENIMVLTNEQATHDDILTTIRRHLIEPAQPGDIVLFAYSGHGSQVVNSQSAEPDKKDETLVPADANQGVWDIRDKELGRLFNDIIDKGASLTVLMDNCHSGSGARGIAPTGKVRQAPLDPRDIATVVGKETPDTRPDPEARGALILSAAQDYQLASEATDEEHGTKHGAFSLALLTVLRTASVQESAEQTFQRVRAVLQTNGRAQEPVLASTQERRRKPLFGATTRGQTHGVTIAVLRTETGGSVDLQGGLGAGLREGCELKKVDTSADSSPVRLRVEQVQGWGRATARVIEGKAEAVKAGDLFAVDRWAAPQTPDLHVWIPPALTQDAVDQLLRELATLRSSERLDWVTDPTETTPTHVLSWDGTAWNLAMPGEKEERLGKTVTAKQVTEKARRESAVNPRLFVNVPPTPELVNALGCTHNQEKSAIDVVTAPQDAHYVLVGRVADATLDYAWVLPAATRSQATDETRLPIRTDWVTIGDASTSLKATAGKLQAFAQRLGRVRAWLHLEAPPSDGNFPYTLAFKNTRTGAVVTTGTVKEGDELQVVLRADEEALKRLEGKRFIYVLGLDSEGKISLLFPLPGQGNVENFVPYTLPPSTEIPLNSQFKVAPPFGLDSYLLLTSAEAIPDPDILPQQGVRTRDRLPETPLARLLSEVGAGTRGQQLVTPVNWSVGSFSLRSAPR